MRDWGEAAPLPVVSGAVYQPLGSTREWDLGPAVLPVGPRLKGTIISCGRLSHSGVALLCPDPVRPGVGEHNHLPQHEEAAARSRPRLGDPAFVRRTARWSLGRTTPPRAGT